MTFEKVIHSMTVNFNINFRIIVLAVFSLANLSVAGANDRLYSDIESDETIVFFRTSSWLEEQSESWKIPIHAWVYEPEDSVVRKNAFAKVLEEKYDLKRTGEREQFFSERTNLLLADNERAKSVVIKLLGVYYELPKSTANGHIKTIISVPKSDVVIEGAGTIEFDAVLGVDDSRRMKGQTRLLSSRGVSVISDIDDTVKLSYVTDLRRLLNSTFFESFSPVDGMSSLYRDLSLQGVEFHFVSSSPWHLYSPLLEFMEDSEFPWATLSLKSIRFKDDTILDLFKEGTETKPQAISEIIDRYPNRKFILFGDGGEQDAEVYAQIIRKYPDQINKVLIRVVEQGSDLEKNYQQIFMGIDNDRWQIFSNAKEIKIDGLMMNEAM